MEKESSEPTREHKDVKQQESRRIRSISPSVPSAEEASYSTRDIEPITAGTDGL